MTTSKKKEGSHPNERATKATTQSYIRGEKEKKGYQQDERKRGERRKRKEGARKPINNKYILRLKKGKMRNVCRMGWMKR
jgi:hypothetical protein